MRSGSKNNYPNNNVINYDLDKDILVKGNKIYSPDTCCFIPKKINILLTGSKLIRGSLPIGVSLKKGKYQSNSNNGEGKKIYLGIYDTPEIAFNTYKIYKENVIVTIAIEYFGKGLISFEVYKALLLYKININD